MSADGAVPPECAPTPLPTAAPDGRSVGWGRIAAAVFIGGIGVVITCLLLYKLRDVLLLFGIGYFIAFLFEPGIAALRRRGLSRVAAVRLVIAALIVALVLIGIALVPMLISQARDAAHNWPIYSDRATEVYESSRNHLEAWLNERYPGLDPSALLDERIEAAQLWLTARVPLALQWASDQIGASLGVLGLTLIVLIISFQFMLLKGQVDEGLQRLIPREHSEEVSDVRTQISSMLGNYIRGLVAVSLLEGVSVGLVMLLVGLIFGSKYALTVAVLAVFSPLVPYVGLAVVVATAGFLTYMTAQHSPLAGALVAVVLVWGVDQVFDLLVKPNLVGRRIHLHPITAMFSVFAGYSLFGFAGLLAGMPLAASVKIILAKWIPVVGADPGVRAPKEPLVLDVGQFASDAWKSIRRWSETVIEAAEQTLDRTDQP